MTKTIKSIHSMLIGVGFLVLLGAQPAIDQSRQNTITRAIEMVSPAVASINVIQVQEFFTPLTPDPFLQFFFPEEFYHKRQVKSSGSGVVISPDGYIITNYHVVENATQVVVTLPGGKEYDAEIVGTDRISDIALLKLDGQDFPYARLGNSDDLIIGEWVVALGNPFGLFDVNKQPSATVGIISAVNMDFGVQQGGRVYKDMIQTDAAINRGNSGGPLVNSRGEVIGINTFIFTGSQFSEGSIGIGFAIPISQAKRIAEELKNSGRIDRSFATGLTVQPLTSKIARYLEIPFSRGVIVVEIEKGSSAEKAHLKEGDIIVGVNGKPVRNSRDILQIIEEEDLRQGDKLKLRIYRDGKYRTTNLVLGKVR
ncbi:MAG: S1C family serine protease [Fidelibacterota bacterium]